ncbi:MFS transporter [Chitinophaga ginsengisoli]|uniref:Fucose permease n=1 Tax=Chitinophaga ginsengisoli TaxID=363837 RepID=A0A2P8GLF8_9BACT|nr:MFS transporter [Chitinophaga ginsengisoli]PSL34801.1 fucose permease [Chitinophaga ginsengisoli]
MSTPRSARIATAVFFFISGFSFSSWASRIPDIQRRLALNKAELGFFLLALPTGLVLTLPVTGYLLQRYSSRNIMMIGVLVFNLMLALIGVVSLPWQLGLVLFCFGSSRNLMNISVNAQSVAVQALYKRSIITTFHGVWSMAGFAAAALGAIMVDFRMAPSRHFLFVSLAMTIMAFLAFRDSPHMPPSPDANTKRFIWPDNHLMKYGLISFAVMACEGTMYDWSNIYFQEAVHPPEKLIAAGYVIYMIAMTTGRFTGDSLVNRLGVATMIRYSGILVLCGFIVSALMPYTISTSIGFLMIGFGVSCVVPLVLRMATQTTSMNSGPAIAAVSTVGYMGFLIVPPLIGFIAEAAGLRWAFALMAMFGLLITVLILQIKETAQTTTLKESIKA